MSEKEASKTGRAKMIQSKTCEAGFLVQSDRREVPTLSFLIKNVKILTERALWKEFKCHGAQCR